MKPNGIVELDINNDKVFISFNGSKNAFVTFTKIVLAPLYNSMIEPTCNMKIKKALYFDKPLTDKELIKLTSD